MFTKMEKNHHHQSPFHCCHHHHRHQVLFANQGLKDFVGCLTLFQCICDYKKYSNSSANLFL